MKVKAKVDGWDIIKDKIYEVIKLDKCEDALIIDEVGKKNWLYEGDYEIVEEGNNMKELTFREVITNIKDGEEWVSIKCDALERIYKRGNVIHFDFTDEFTAVSDKEALYTLQRKQYTFEEAFKAFEEGREIESCIDGYSYKIQGKVLIVLFKGEEISRMNKKNTAWNIQQIKGKWYIND